MGKKTSLFLRDCNMHKEEEGRSVGDREVGRFRAEIRIDNSNTKMKSRCRIRIINEKNAFCIYM
jgi:hypothetical protein